MKSAGGLVILLLVVGAYGPSQNTRLRPNQEVSALSSSQSMDPLAAQSVDRVLQGAKIYDLPEGRGLVNDNSWSELTVPLISHAETLYETMFKTDLPAVVGYKRLMEVSGPSDEHGQVMTSLQKRIQDVGEKLLGERNPRSGQVATERFLAVAYKDQSNQQWKVFSIGTDTDTAVQVTSKRNYGTVDVLTLHGVKPSMKRYSYAAALIADGQLAQADVELRSTLDMIPSEKAPTGYKATAEDVSKLRETIRKISGR